MGKTAVPCFIFAFFLIFLSGSVPAAAAIDPETARIYLPEPLIPRLAAEGKTLLHGVPVKAVVADPDPAAPRSRIPSPAGLTVAPAAATASFSITYVPDGGADPWGEPCYTFPEAAKAAFNAAADIWANTVGSDVPVTIRACWADLGSSTTLGYSGGGSLYRDFAGAPRASTWYAVSLANALHGSDLEPGEVDMHITYNRNFTWYYGTDGNTPSGQYDLMTVVLHEIAHGLNFSGSMQYSGRSGSWGYGTGYPNIYDVFMRDGSGAELINTVIYPNPSPALGSALVSDDIWFHGFAAMAANGNLRVKMYAPGTWSSGSSYSHLDYNTFNNTSNQLMVYAISDGESIHDPGAVTGGLLQDLGWTVTGSPGPVNLTMAVLPAGAGTTIPAVGTTAVPPAIPQAISATASGGFDFVSWSVSGSAVLDDPDALSTAVTLTGDATVTANFCFLRTWHPDGDGDGYGNPAGPTVNQCSRPAGYVADNTDCDDTDATINPGAAEVCDGVDNNCDGLVDEGVMLTWHLDSDQDGYGDPADSIEQCSRPAGYVADNTDCDDADALEHPDQTWYKDGDSDGYSDGTTIVACLRPEDYYAASELKRTSGDPDDTDPAIIPGDFPWPMFMPAIQARGRQ